MMDARHPKTVKILAAQWLYEPMHRHLTHAYIHPYIHGIGVTYIHTYME